MKTKSITITLNAAEARMLAFWMREHLENIGAIDMTSGQKTELLTAYPAAVRVHDKVMSAAQELNPTTSRVMA